MASQIDAPTSASQSAAVDLFLAVDTGGTKTCACLVDFSRPEESRIVGRGRSSGGNPFSVGFAEATRAEHQLAHDQQRPAFADQFHRQGGAAGIVIPTLRRGF